LSPVEQEFLTLDDLAERWQVKKPWIYNNHVRLEIPSMPLGRGLRFRRKYIEEWERRHHRYLNGLDLEV
jgi:predicted DNA-binding transcriptional regulator AlpA